MKKNIFIALLILSVGIFFTGCSIKQEINPVSSNINIKEICIIKDSSVREGFLNTYSKLLKERGYKVKILTDGSPLDSCKITTTYMGKWSWDLALYLSYATIKVYENGELVGSSLYDSRQGSGRVFEKFGSGDKYIEEFVSKLYGN